MTNLPQNLREFDDTDKARELIYKGALDSVSKRFPVEDDEYRIELTNPRYTGPQDFSLEQQKQALMKERRLTTPITGTWRLIHKPTNSVLDQRDDVVMQIPYYTQRGTFINGGNEYSVVSQSRLRPGVYVRRQRTGEVEAHFNVRPGKGKPFRIQLEPETGVFKLVIGQSANPLYPMLRAMGITDQQLIKSWGPDLLSANVKKQDARALPKIYQRMAGYKADPAADASAQERYLRDSLPLFELDADVNARTLGLQNATGITPEVLLRTTGKMLGVSRGEEDADDRDSPQFSHVFSIEDMIRERIDKDAGRLTQQLLRKVRRTRNLQPVRRGALNSYLDSLLLGSGLAMPLEETNPLHTLEQLHRVTKLGEGGIGSAEAITDEARDVNPGQFCYDDETMVLTSDGFKYWRDVTEDTLLACDCGDAVGFYKPVAVTHEHYSGPMVGIANKYLDYLVTPNHRVYCSTHKKPTAFRCEEAVAVYKAQRNYRVGGTPYIDKNDCPTHFTVPLAEIVPGHPGRSLTAHTFAAEDWATFMGWFLAEGSTVVDDKRHSFKVQIAQSATANPAKCAAIAALLERMGLASCYTGAAFTVASKDIVAYLRPLGYAHEKRIPRYFFNYSYACRLALFDAMAAGDGSTADNGSVRYVTTSYGLALDYAELALSLGYSATICEVTSKPLNDRCRKRWRVGVSRTRAVIHTGYSSKARLADAVELDYDGMVHCARVPGGLLLVMRNGKSVWSGNSFIDPITGPEGLNIGIDVRTAYRTFKGDDNNIYGEFRNPHTGKLEYLRPDQAADKIIAFPGQNIAEAKTVYAMKRGRVERVPRDEVDYQVPSFGHMMSPNTNLNPMPTSVQPGRQFYGSKFWSQYMPQVKGEVPLVDSLMPDGKSTFTEHYGRKVGTIQSKVGGTVTKVTDDTITVTDADGKKHVTQLVKNFPFNRLTGLSYFPAVKVGDPVAPGDMVAHSNFTDAKTGALNMGHNLKTAIIPYKGRSYEDAYVISESAAQKMATERLYGFDLGAKHGVELGRGKYMSAFPRNFTQDQIDTLDSDGVVKPGTVLHKGDPIIVAVGPRLLTSADSQLGKLHKVLRNAFTDKSQVWEYAWPGTVTDVAMTHNGARVNVKSTPPVSVGDKLSTRFGLKGVVGHIVPDDKMPRDVVTNEPYELLLNPMAVLSRVAPNQIMEMALGKLAKIKGEQLRIPQEPPPEGWANWVEQQLREHGVDEATDLFDPDTGRTVKRIGDGYVYVSAFHHLAEKKLSSRGETGGYTADEQPARGGYSGAKKFSQMDINAALAHGATDVIKDVVTIRGTKNEDFWKALKLGRPLPEPRTPFIYDKFLNTLRAGGINVTEKGDTTSLLPMTDDDVDKLSKGRIDNSDMVDSDFEPMRGGLFDPGRTGGAAGNRWTHIELPEPVPNPVMEEPVRRLLGLKIQDMEDILAGRKDLDGKTGGGALKAALDRIDIDRMLDEHKQKIRTLRGANRDNSMKILGYLASAKEQGIHPSKWMISKVPVLPPVFRPVSRMGDVALMADLNELYRDVIENAKSFQELRKDLPESELAEERLNLYKSVQAAYGLGESITPEGQSKRLKGAIRQVIGTSPKYGLFQSKVISKPVDVVGRGVVTPDPNLDMDQVGIPEDSAWALYKDFVMRGLVRHGYPALRASEMIEQRTPEAKDALEKEMQTRPVLLDRAPTWHKFNLLAFYPHITEGHTIRVSPLVTKGFNMDFDGDQANFHVPVSDKAVDQAKRKMLPSANLFSLTDLKSIRHSPSMEMTMGLYWLTRPAAGKPVRVFASTKAAKDAYRNGEIAANDPIEIRG